jgi:hypothetical protein
MTLNSCASQSQKLINSDDVKTIEIKNGTNNRNIPNKIILTDRMQIDWLVREINSMEPLSSDVGVKANFGDYDMRIKTQDGSERVFFVIYTTYNGIVIQGYNKLGTAMDQFYKNDKLEMVILKIFQEIGNDGSK